MKMLSVKIILPVLLTITVIKCGEVDEKRESDLPVISDRCSDEINETGVLETDLNPTVAQVFKEIKQELTSPEFVDKAKSTLSDVAGSLKAALGQLRQLYQIVSGKTESPEVAEKINEESSLAGTSTGTNTQSISEEVEPRNVNQKIIGLVEGYVQTYKDLSKTVEDAELKNHITRFTLQHLVILKNKLKSEKTLLKKQLESGKATIGKIHQASVEVSNQGVEQPAETSRKVD
ncbi:uncharacterized protein LOC126846040 [Adelges cooleyi]|uniref:uncharacterized protein LOC126846040 n=1 Tax=Adelges cooleyi TaxID=133065 RepID=UPI0021807E83|nr:uncharacterized protein LOC126846040 [Adelges cooleyi]